MFFACGIWCLADVSSVGPSSGQTSKLISDSDQFSSVLFYAVLFGFCLLQFCSVLLSLILSCRIIYHSNHFFLF